MERPAAQMYVISTQRCMHLKADNIKLCSVKYVWQVQRVDEDVTKAQSKQAAASCAMHQTLHE